MPQQLIFFCLTLLRKGNTIFGIMDIYEAYRGQTEFIFGDYYMASNAVGWRMEKISNNGVPKSLGDGAWRQYDAVGRLQQYGRGSNLIAGLILQSNEQPDRRRL